MRKFSFIVPVYNAEKTIVKCVDSVLAQKDADFELLLIDDGSTDNSFAVCEQYQKIDARIKALTQKNAGPSASRNKGLELACGEWVCFVDSDDWIAEDYLTRLRETIDNESPDIVFWGYAEVDADGNVGSIHLPEVTAGSKPETFAELSAHDLFGYTWLKCIKKSCIEGLRFPEDMRLLEDEVFACAVAQHCSSVAIINEPLYYYRIGYGGSLMTRTHSDYCRLCDRVFLAWKKLLGSDPCAEAALSKRAASLTDCCRYYWLERDVNARSFLDDLSKTTYFAYSNGDTAFADDLKNGRYLRLGFSRVLYRVKTKVAALLNKNSD